MRDPRPRLALALAAADVALLALRTAVVTTCRPDDYPPYPLAPKP